MQALSFSPALRERDLVRFHDQAVALAAANSASIALREPSGLHVVKTLVPLGTNPMPSTVDPVLRRADALAVSTRAPVASDLYVGAAGKRPYVSMILPVILDGDVRYLLTMAVTPERILGKLRLGDFAPQGWLSSVVGSDGRIIARTRENDRFVGQPATATFRDGMAGRQSGTMRSTTLDGVDVFTAFETGASGWTTVVSVPAAVLEAPARRLAWALGAIVALVLATTLLGAWLYGQRIGRELASLADNARRMGAHLPLEPYPTGISEVAAAQQALAKASRKADELLHELDHRVKNTLAVILSVVSRGVADAGQRDTLGRRIGALVQAHEALSRRRWEGVLLHPLVEAIGSDQRLSLNVEGPEMVLAPRTSTSLAQVFQELCSNTLAHGAPGAAVELVWTVEEGALRIVWSENRADASPPSFEPRFGFKLVDLCVRRQLDGSFEVLPHGGRWTVVLRFPLESGLGRAAWPAPAAE